MAIRSMTGQAFFVLTALADGPRHGYGIVREVTELSQGRVKLKIGSLYGVLDRLATEGPVRERYKNRVPDHQWRGAPRELGNPKLSVKGICVDKFFRSANHAVKRVWACDERPGASRNGR